MVYTVSRVGRYSGRARICLTSACNTITYMRGRTEALPSLAFISCQHERGGMGLFVTDSRRGLVTSRKGGSVSCSHSVALSKATTILLPCLSFLLNGPAARCCTCFSGTQCGTAGAGRSSCLHTCALRPGAIYGTEEDRYAISPPPPNYSLKALGWASYQYEYIQTRRNGEATVQCDRYSVYPFVHPRYERPL